VRGVANRRWLGGNLGEEVPTTRSGDLIVDLASSATYSRGRPRTRRVHGRRSRLPALEVMAATQKKMAALASRKKRCIGDLDGGDGRIVVRRKTAGSKRRDREKLRAPLRKAAQTRGGNGAEARELQSARVRCPYCGSTETEAGRWRNIRATTVQVDPLLHERPQPFEQSFQDEY